MLFMITQTHAPEKCPRDEGGLKPLHEDPDQVEGLTVRGIYGAWSEHTVYYLVEAEDYAAVHKFVFPGMLRTTARITPVEEA